jgi:hypothetical protein
MVKSISTALCLFLAFNLFCQQKIDNALTIDHENILGSKICIIPPDGFKKSDKFAGLEHKRSGSSIMVNEMQTSYDSISNGLNKENFLKQGVHVSLIENITINEVSGLLFTATQVARGSNYGKYILFFGTNEETYLIVGVYPENETEVGLEIKKSILTAVTLAEHPVDQINALDFTLDVSQTKFKLGNGPTNVLMYTVDGKIPTNSEDKSVLIATKSFSESRIDDHRKFAENRIKNLDITINKTEYINELKINGISGIEIYAKGQNPKNGDIENVYLVILFTRKNYYMLVGITNDESQVSIDEFKKAIKTFELK